MLLHSDNESAVGHPSDALAIVSLTAVAAVGTADESLSRVRMDYAQRCAFACYEKFEFMNTSQQILSLCLSSRKSYYVSNVGSLFSTTLYGPKRSKVRE
jgi:hypothetical protein